MEKKNASEVKNTDIFKARALEFHAWSSLCSLCGAMEMMHQNPFSEFLDALGLIFSDHELRKFDISSFHIFVS